MRNIFFTKRLFFAILSISLSANSAVRPEICSYAKEKTKSLVPTLCDLLDSDSHLESLWESAYISSQTKKISVLLLSGGGFVLTTIGSYNATKEAGNCKELIYDAGSEKCVKGPPIAPFFAAGGVFFISSILALALPNWNLDAALEATRKIRADSNQNIGKPPQNKLNSTQSSKEKSCEELNDRVLQFECNRNRRMGKINSIK